MKIKKKPIKTGEKNQKKTLSELAKLQLKLIIRQGPGLKIQMRHFGDFQILCFTHSFSEFERGFQDI